MQTAYTFVRCLGHKRSLAPDTTVRKRVCTLASKPAAKPAVCAPSDTCVVYTDGSCVNNGKPGARAGYGVWFADGDADNVAARLAGKQTNQRAELMAAVVALEQCQKRRVARVRLMTDSKYVVNGMDDWIHNWKRNGWKTADRKSVNNADLFKRLDELRMQIKTEFVHVKAHSGIVGNERVDALAKRGGALPSV